MKVRNVETFLPRNVIPKPIKTLKTMICNMLPSAIDVIGFVGNIPTIVLIKLVSGRLPLSYSRPCVSKLPNVPGLINNDKPRAMTIATAVVVMK